MLSVYKYMKIDSFTVSKDYITKFIWKGLGSIEPSNFWRWGSPPMESSSMTAADADGDGGWWRVGVCVMRLRQTARQSARCETPGWLLRTSDA